METRSGIFVLHEVVLEFDVEAVFFRVGCACCFESLSRIFDFGTFSCALVYPHFHAFLTTNKTFRLDSNRVTEIEGSGNVAFWWRPKLKRARSPGFIAFLWYTIVVISYLWWEAYCPLRLKAIRKLSVDSGIIAHFSVLSLFTLHSVTFRMVFR